MDRLSVTPSGRKPAGIALILLLILGWAALVASAAPLLDGLPWPVHALYYFTAGIAWILPLKPLLTWMETGRWRHQKKRP
jgi:Protein of unknown function (DUF2842)